MTGPPLPADRKGIPAPEPLIRMRSSIPDQLSLVPSALAIRRRHRNGVPCLELAPADPRATMLYLHGGGFRMGQGAAWAGFAARLAERLNIRVILPEYRLAPEHPFPSGLRDCLAVYASISEEPFPFLVAGDSAGGGLAVSTLVLAIRQRLPLPIACALLSPWLDLTLSGESFTSRKESDRLFPPASARDAAGMYLQGHDPFDPLASPLFAEVEHFPPCILFAGTSETLLADTVRFVSRLADANVGVQAGIYARMQHIWPIAFPDLPEAEQAIDALVRFADRHLSKASLPC